jgi:hypothetical protein
VQVFRQEEYEALFKEQIEKLKAVPETSERVDGA